MLAGSGAVAARDRDPVARLVSAWLRVLHAHTARRHRLRARAGLRAAGPGVRPARRGRLLYWRRHWRPGPATPRVRRRGRPVHGRGPGEPSIVGGPGAPRLLL